MKKADIDSEKLARICAEVAAGKKAEDIVAIDLRGVSTFTDFYVICSGSSEPQLKAIASEVADTLTKEHGIRPMGTDGFPLSQWVVADYGSVLLHIFHTSKREIYRLEELWNDAPRLKL
jgi:ribosome-associated protein